MSTESSQPTPPNPVIARDAEPTIRAESSAGASFPPPKPPHGAGPPKRAAPKPERTVRAVARAVQTEVAKLGEVEDDLVKIGVERITDGVAELEEAAFHMRRDARRPVVRASTDNTTTTSRDGRKQR
jgi:hypothetical protein